MIEPKIETSKERTRKFSGLLVKVAVTTRQQKAAVRKF